jgi:acetolactate synthase-1/2/3 large subunit
MGFALPAAIGAKLARPEAEVWVVVGDGGFQMTMGELATLRQERLDIKIAVINNGYLGMVRQLQEFYHEKRYAEVAIGSPDFVTLAAAYGIEAHRITQRSEVGPTVRGVHGSGAPALIEFQVDRLASVYPMVLAGSALHEMERRDVEIEEKEIAS